MTMNLLRGALILALGLGFNFCLSIFRDASYTPFAIDAYHLSNLGAFLCATTAGALIHKAGWLE